MMKKTLQHGHLEHLMEMTNLDMEAFNPFVDFENWFMRYGGFVQLQVWSWHFDKEEPYVFIETLGVFTDLNKLAIRIKNEIGLALRNSTIDINAKEFKCEYTSLGDYNMELSHPWENYSFHLVITDVDRTDALGANDSNTWKFDLPKDKI